MNWNLRFRHIFKIVTVVISLVVAATLTSCSTGTTLSIFSVSPKWNVNTSFIDHRPNSCPTQSKIIPIHSKNSTVPGPDQNLPINFSNGGGDWKLGSQRSTSASVFSNPQELCGVEGMSVDRAWNYSTGSNSTVIAVLDSGIEWCDPSIVSKIAINTQALPPPENSNGFTKSEIKGAKFSNNDPYDLNNSGIINVNQYAQDPRVVNVARMNGGFFCSQQSKYSYTGISPEDLIRTFSKPIYPNGMKNPNYVEMTGPEGFQDAIAGWNFVDNNNDPYDDVHYDHGTGEAEDSSGAPGNLLTEVGSCPSCMILPVRVSDSFVAFANNFAEAAYFAVDSGANVIQEALGTLDYTKGAQDAINYAFKYGVPVVASAADEESSHQNLPSSLDHTIVVNSITKDTSFNPPSYLYINSCTNYGPNITASAESASCSSEATGKTAGIVGLIESYANLLLKQHKISPYPGLKNIRGKNVALSVNEVKQLVSMTADDVNFETPVKGVASARANNYSVSSPGIPFATTTRYPTTPGFDPYTGYGRINAARLLAWISSNEIPPTAFFNSPSWFSQYNSNSNIKINVAVGAPRASFFKYKIDVGVGDNPKGSNWHIITSGQSKGIQTETTLISVSQLINTFPSQFKNLSSSIEGNPTQFEFTLRVEVIDSNGMVAFSRRTDFINPDENLLANFPVKFGGSTMRTGQPGTFLPFEVKA